MLTLIAVLLALPSARASSPSVVVFCERGFPYFGANQAISPRIIADTLTEIGVSARLADSRQVAEGALREPSVRCLVWCYGNVFPREAADEIARFHRSGGCIVATGVPFTHPCVRGESGGRFVWRDEGHQDFSGHDHLGMGPVAGFVPRERAVLRPVANAPFVLSPMRTGSGPCSCSVPAGMGGFFYLTQERLPPGDELTGIVGVSVGVSDGEALRGCVVAAVKHGCAQFKGAVDVWAGTQWLSDPRDPAEVLLSRQLVLRSTLYALQVADCLPGDAARKAVRKLDAWCARQTLPRREPLAFRPILRRHILPRSPQVRASDKVTVHSVASDDQATRTALACLQGLVNRARPRLYFIYSDHDKRWLKWYREREYIGKTEEVPEADAVVARFRKAARGAVLVEERFLNVGLALASVRDAVVCTPEQARRWRLPVIADLRGRWRAEADAYGWAFRTLWPQMNHNLLCHGHPKRSPQQTDYLVAQRVFTFFIPGGVDGADEGHDPVPMTILAEELLAQTAPQGPIIGWWGWSDPPEGIGEYWGMTLASRYAHTTIGTEFLTNMTFHSGIPAPDSFRQEQIDRLPPVPLNPSKVYVAVSVLDSGNDPWYWLRCQRDVWEAPGRGQTATGWIIGPALLDLAPGIAEWYYAHLTDRDELICATSGLGYMNVRDYGTAFADREAVMDDFLAYTREYMGRMDLRSLQTYHGSWGEEPDFSRRGELAQFIEALPALDALLPDIGRHEATRYGNANYLLKSRGCHRRLDDGTRDAFPAHWLSGRGSRALDDAHTRDSKGPVPVFHCLTRYNPWTYSADVGARSEDSEVAGLMGEIRTQTPLRRPAFISAFALSWTFRPEMINRAAAELGPEYVFVTPHQLATLYRQAMSRGPGLQTEASAR